MLKIKSTKTFILFAFLICTLNVNAARNIIVYANINGMTCQFCAYGLQKSLRKVPQIKTAIVSLARKQAKVELRSGQKLNSLLIIKIRKAISRAGYTPGNIR